MRYEEDRELDKIVKRLKGKTITSALVFSYDNREPYDDHYPCIVHMKVKGISGVIVVENLRRGTG